MRRLLCLALAAVASLVAASGAQAATFAVNSTADQSDVTPGNGVCLTASLTCTLRAAIEESNIATGVDTIDVPAGIYLLTAGELVVGQSALIDGAGAGATVISAGGASFRVFHIAVPFGAAAPPPVIIRDVTVTGGRPELSSTLGGGGILNEPNAGLIIEDSVITGNHPTAKAGTGNGGGGISNESGGDLTLRRTTVSGNSLEYSGTVASSGGGGIHNGAGELIVEDSTISGNLVRALSSASETGGGGLNMRGGPLTLTNSTISGNQALVPADATNGGGGAFFAAAGTLRNVTLSGNSTSATGGGVLASHSDVTFNVQLANSIFAGNSPIACGKAGLANFLSTDSNMEFPGNSCQLGVDDFPNSDPLLGPLASNGGPTQTHALTPGSPAINAASAPNCRSAQHDQRGLARPFPLCDIGAYEFEGLSARSPRGAHGPVLSGSGSPHLPAGSSVLARFRIDGGSETAAPRCRELRIDHGSRGHALASSTGASSARQSRSSRTTPPTVVVDTIPPLVALASEQGKSGYTVGEKGSFRVTASDAGTGLQTDPTATGQPIDTSKPGNVTVSRTAVDNCANQASAQRIFRILPRPVYGRRVNLIPVSGEVFVAIGGTRRGGGARASQKGQRFVPLEQARQVPVGTLVDTRDGTVELVSARNRRATKLQSGRFLQGVFQVLQSRARKAKGLTELRLKGSSFNRCRPRARVTGAGASQLSRRTIRRLRANARGRFRTRGRHSAATVRGTIWITADRCDGTLTKVSRGKVAVRDFRRSRTITLRAGKSYLARAPR